MLLALLVIASAAYALAVVWLMRQEATLVFEAGSTLGTDRPPFAYEQIDVPRTDGARQFAWVMPRPGAADAPWVVYLHGNATTIASSVNIAHYRMLSNAGLNVLAPEYRGFGGLAGEPTKASLQADARAAYDYLATTRKVPPSRIILYGWSLGSAVVVNLAAAVQPPAVILEGAPASLVDIMQRRYPFFPLRLVIRDPFEPIQTIGAVTSPLLFLHSPEDEVIPLVEGRRLFDAARGEKQFITVRGGHFQAIDLDGPRIEQAIRELVKP